MTDSRRRTYGTFRCSTPTCSRSYTSRVDQPRKNCHLCRRQLRLARRNNPTPETVYETVVHGKSYSLTFKSLIPTHPPKYRSYALFSCGCGVTPVTAEIRRVVSGEKFRCKAGCKGVP